MSGIFRHLAISRYLCSAIRPSFISTKKMLSPVNGGFFGSESTKLPKSL